MFNAKAQNPCQTPLLAPTLILGLLKFCSIKSEAVITLISMKPSNVWCIMCDMGSPAMLLAIECQYLFQEPFGNFEGG